MAKRKIGLMELSELIDITPSNLSILKNSKAKAIRFSTLEEICRALNCQPGDILGYVEDKKDV
jgi:putative transcriptional regulator